MSSFTTSDWIIIFFVCQVYTFGYWIRGAIAPITDVLEEEFNGTATQIGLLSSILYLSYLLFQLPSGLLLQIYCGEFIVIVSAFGLALSSLAFSYSPTIELAIPFHFFNGVFVAPAWIAAVSVASERFGSSNTALSTGIMIFWCKLWIVALSTFQAMIYEEYGTWRVPFIGLTAILSLIAVLMTLAVMVETKPGAEEEKLRMDSITELIEQELDSFDHFNEGTATAVTAATNGHHHDNRDRDDRSPLISKESTPRSRSRCCSIYRADSKDKSFMDRLRKMGRSLSKTLKNPYNYLIGVWGFCACSVSYALNGLWLVSYLMLKYGYSRSLATFIVGLFYLGMAFGSIICGKIANKYKIRKCVIIVGVLLIGIGSCSVIYVLDGDAAMSIVILMNFVCGFGYGAIPVSMALIREYNNQYECSDTATAFCYALQVGSGFAVQYLIGDLLDYSWERRGGDDFVDGGNEREYNVDDYDFAFLTIPATLGLALVLSFCVRETHGEDIDVKQYRKQSV